MILQRNDIPHKTLISIEELVDELREEGVITKDGRYIAQIHFTLGKNEKVTLLRIAEFDEDAE